MTAQRFFEIAQRAFRARDALAALPADAPLTSIRPALREYLVANAVLDAAESAFRSETPFEEGYAADLLVAIRERGA
jgi:hypothetical protein